MDRLHAHPDGDDGGRHVSGPAGGRVGSGRGLPKLLPRLPDRRGHPPGAPRQRQVAPTGGAVAALPSLAG